MKPVVLKTRQPSEVWSFVRAGEARKRAREAMATAAYVKEFSMARGLKPAPTVLGQRLLDL